MPTSTPRTWCGDRETRLRDHPERRRAIPPASGRGLRHHVSSGPGRRRSHAESPRDRGGARKARVQRCVPGLEHVAAAVRQSGRPPGDGYGHRYRWAVGGGLPRRGDRRKESDPIRDAAPRGGSRRPRVRAAGCPSASRCGPHLRPAEDDDRGGLSGHQGHALRDGAVIDAPTLPSKEWKSPQDPDVGAAGRCGGRRGGRRQRGTTATRRWWRFAGSRQTGIGTPRSLQGRAVSATCRLIGLLIDLWGRLTRAWGSNGHRRRSSDEEEPHPWVRLPGVSCFPQSV